MPVAKIKAIMSETRSGSSNSNNNNNQKNNINQNNNNNNNFNNNNISDTPKCRCRKVECSSIFFTVHIMLTLENVDSHSNSKITLVCVSKSCTPGLCVSVL